MRFRDAVHVDACLRDGVGGSPTAVVEDHPGATDEERRAVPTVCGTSHAAFLSSPGLGDGEVVRFFTATGELVGCGHGTVAAQAVHLDRMGVGALARQQRTGGRRFDVTARRLASGAVEVWFDQGPVALRTPSAEERASILAALGVGPDQLHADHEVMVASPGTPRLLVPVAGPDELWALAPEVGALADACRRTGQLGCFVYVPPGRGRNAAARMFAPAIGVPEDIANANSTGCLAVYLHSRGGTASVRVDQGDTRGHPSTVYAAVRGTGDDLRVWVGGVAGIRAGT